MRAFSITGGSPVCGTLRVAGNKNAALPMIAAALLTRETVVLRNVPEILDVARMLEIARRLGAKVERDGGTVAIAADGLSEAAIPKELCHAVRASLLFAGPLLVRLGEAALYPPGGDVIGRRRLDPHFYGLAKLGASHELRDGQFRFRRGGARLKGAEMILDEPSVMATEHILTAAATAEGTTILRNAACEPHVTQLAELLNAMGARISGVGTNLLVVEGVPQLHGAEFTLASDHVNAASYLALAAATRGQVELTGEIIPHDYWMTRRVFERLGVTFRIEPGLLLLDQRGRPMQVHCDLDGVMPTISDGPWPQFPSDMMSCLITLATQAQGAVLFFEKMFESRIYFVDRLIAMGANAVICDPHRAVISGPVRLHATELLSPDIRAGMALVIAACAAEGTSLIRNIDMVCRGYGRLADQLRQLGVRLDEVDC